MTPIPHSQCSYHPPPEGSHDRHALQPLLPIYEASSFPCVILRNPYLGGSLGSDHQHSHHPQEADEHFPCNGPTWQISSLRLSPPIAEDVESKKGKNTQESDLSSSDSVKWMSSKMRIMRKMMNSDGIANIKPREITLQPQDQLQTIKDSNSSSSSSKDNQSPPTGTIRVCSECNTTKTPLWRSGPRGPKSLCNACGIRQRKARKAAMAAAGLLPAVEPAATKVRKPKISHGEYTVPFKKRCKFTSPDQTRKEIHLDDFTVCSGKNSSAFQRAFPQDEKEAAILLMALSCGVIRG